MGCGSPGPGSDPAYWVGIGCMNSVVGNLVGLGILAQVPGLT